MQIFKLLSLSLALLMLTACAKKNDPPKTEDPKKWSEPIVLASYNMEVTGNNPSAPWLDRLPLMKQILEKYDLDIIGVQEAFMTQLYDLNLGTKYGIIDHSIAGDNGVSRTPIMYKKEKFNVLKNGVFWLAENPSNSQSKAWDAPRPRICNWGIFQDKVSKVTFFMVNVHVWHQPLGIIAQEEGLKLLLQKMKTLSEGYPIILTGDFNIDQTKAHYRLVDGSGLVKDSYGLTNSRTNGGWGTFNGHNFNSAPTLRIDHVFVENSKVAVNRWEILIDSYDKKFPSDHFPVKTDLRFLL